MAKLPPDDIESIVQNQKSPIGGCAPNWETKETYPLCRGKDSFSAEELPDETKTGYLNQPNRKQPQQKSTVKKPATTTEEVSALGSIQKKNDCSTIVLITGCSIGLFLLMMILLVCLIGFVTNWKF